MDFITSFLREQFYKGIIRYLQEEPPRIAEIHVTDIANVCIRRAYYSKVYPLPISMKQALIFAIGRKIHEIPIFPEGHEMELSYEGIVGRVDEYANGILIDKKTTRNIPKQVPPHIVNQLRYYRVLLEKNGYKVLHAYVLYINVTDLTIKFFPISLSEPLENIEREMIRKKELLEESLKKREPPPRVIGEWCQECEYASLCYATKK